MRFTTIEEEIAVTKFKKGIEREIEGYFEEKGFNLIEPPIFQKYDKYMASNYRQDSSAIVKVLGGGSNILVLRPDITINVLGDIFSKWEGDYPLKIYYNSKVYYNGPESWVAANHQMGIESLGEDVLVGDTQALEMASIILGILKEPYILEIGYSKYLDGFFNEIQLSIDDENELKELISKKNRCELKDKVGKLALNNTLLDRILDIQGDIEDVVDMAAPFCINGEMKESIEQLEKIREFLVDKGYKENIKLDLSMIADYHYYDGLIFKGYSISSPKKILSGGRYDRLTEEFEMRVPAIGFMVDMDYITRIRIGGENGGKGYNSNS
ncbi:MAG TPA: hypothetical protein GXZ78_05575 [Eubacteriaceae bacterium]|nr:hypothetical protein [Eubacteriaceae bacterium]